MKKALVTGGAGFIGSHVAEALLEAGCLVTIVDDLSSGSLDNLPAQAEFHKLDIRSPRVGELIDKKKTDVIFHLAAQIDVRKSVRDPLFDADVNVLGSLRLLEWCKTFGVGKFIFASTGGAIYGEQDYFPAAEDHPCRPVSPYGIAKLTIERYMFFYHYEYGLNATALRYANVYGPRQNPYGEAGVVAIFTEKMLKGEQAYIWGDGLQTRDYIYVGDIARLNRLAMDISGFNIINAGTGIETDVIAIFETIRALTGSSLSRVHRPPAAGEQRRSSIDAGYAQTLLGWKPEVELQEGLKRTVAFFKESHAKKPVSM